MRDIYIVGAGLSGLSASIHAKVKRFNVKLFESSNLIGGRCRSFFEKKLGIEIDNGNHLVFSANENFYELCKIVDSVNKIEKLPPNLDFFDLKKKLYWNLDLSRIDILQMLRGDKNLIPHTSFISLSINFKIFVREQKKNSSRVSWKLKNISNILGSFNIGRNEYLK